MIQKIKVFALMVIVTIIAYVASAGVGTYSWLGVYQPAPPKELKR